MKKVVDFSKINFHDLRLYATKIGVKSPTVYNKGELIEKIKEVENGMVLPEEQKRGRPRKENLYFEEDKTSPSKKEIMFEIKNLIGMMENVLEMVSKLKD